MHYLERGPRPDLAPWIACTWTLRDGPGAAPPGDPLDLVVDRCFPDGTAGIIFNFGDPLAWRPRLDGAFALRAGRAFAVGAITRTLAVRYGRRVDLLGVSFRPGRLHPFLRSPAHAVTDAVHGLDEHWGTGGEALVDRLGGEPDPARRVALLEDELAHRLRPPRGDDPLDALVRWAARGPRAPSVDELARHAGWSRQHLARRFREIVGLSPKRFCRVLRFQRALGLLAADAPVHWASAALELGYCDQAHLIAEFRDLAGAAPSRLL